MLTERETNVGWLDIAEGTIGLARSGLISQGAEAYS